jgi:short-subunit dehydrogenase
MDMIFLKSLKEKTVLITGAAGGIGSITSKRLFLKEGVSLILIDLDLKKLEKLKQEILDKYKNHKKFPFKQTVDIYKVDLSSWIAIEQFYKKIKTKRIDILINNAGIVYTGTFGEMNLTDFKKVVDINLFAAVKLTHLLLPELTKNKGHIVNVASGAGLVAPGGLTPYAASKFALVGFSESLRAELYKNVGVSVICPAFVATDLMKNSLMNQKIVKEEKDKHIDTLGNVLHKIGTNPEKIAKIIIKSIKKRKGLRPVGIITHLGYFHKKISLRYIDFINAIIFKQLIKRKIMK